MSFSLFGKSTGFSTVFYPSLLCLLVSCGGDNKADADKSVIIDPPALADTSAPTADVLFPWPISRTDAAYIKVNGTASDDSGIKEIRVNGVVAAMTSTNDKVVIWHAEVQSAKALVVETEDIYGNISSAADTVEILTGVIPRNFIVDDKNQRIIGNHSDLDKIITINLATFEQEVITLDDTISRGNLAYSGSEDMLLHAVESNGYLTISSLDLTSGFTRVLFQYEIDEVPEGEGWLDIENVDFAQDENALYLLVNYTFYEKSDSSLVLKYDLATKTMTTIADGATLTGKDVYTHQFSYTDNGLIISNYSYLGESHYSDDGVFALGLDGSDLNQLMPGSSNTPYSITADLENNIAYLTGFEGIEKLNMTTLAKETLSLDADESELNLSQIISSDLDLTNQQLLISDSDLDMIVAVDLSSGVRSKFMHNGVGNGKPLVSPLDFVLDEKNNIAYIADNGGNAQEVVHAVDLATGDRTQIGDINNQYNVWVEDIVLDGDANILYVIFAEEILRINIATEETDVLTGELTGTGISLGYLTGGTLDASNNRLLVTDGEKSLIIAIDLTTGDRSVISSTAMGIGSGEALGWISNIELDIDNNSAFVISRTERAVFTLDLDTGNRKRLLDSCVDALGENTMQAEFGVGENLFFDVQAKELLITGNNLLSYKMADKNCRVTDLQRIFDISVTTKGQVLATSNKVMLQLDTNSGEQVTISK